MRRRSHNDAMAGLVHSIRLGAAMALVCAICLPLSQCAHARHPPPYVAETFRLFPRNDGQFDYVYAAEELGFSWKGMLTLVAFTWPVPAILLGRRCAGSRFGWVGYVAEVLLCAGTVYWLICLTLFGDWLYGSYVVVISMILFACTALFLLYPSVSDLVRILWQKLAPGRPTASPALSPEG